REFLDAEIRCIWFTQRFHYPRELFNDLHETPRDLVSLSPFLDERGILRVGGRLENHHRHFAPSTQS
ncbi:hypothetical protein, partial [Klebsiella pneumoniae]|uniref:hypothetical protein n=1 Tax=Klebsiella pneumoniae TaxID=573 RepID=UPI0040556806